MMVTILYRLEGEPSTEGCPNPFDDVREGLWYTDAIKWGAMNGIVLGYGYGKFGPNDPVTKEQLAALIYRTEQAHGKIPPDAPEDKVDFYDADTISDWAKGSVTALNSQGIFKDIPGGGFNPKAPALRNEIASMLHRYLLAL